MRLIPKLLCFPFGSNRRYEKANRQYQWFRRGENRFKANGLHGHSGSLFFEAFDEGLKDLPKNRYMAALRSDMAQHTVQRFAATAMARLKVIPRWQKGAAGSLNQGHVTPTAD